MRSIIIGLSVVVLSHMSVCHASTKVFSWTDADGVIHFSDTKPAETAAPSKSLKSFDMQEAVPAAKIPSEETVQPQVQAAANDAATQTQLAVPQQGVQDAESQMKQVADIDEAAVKAAAQPMIKESVSAASDASTAVQVKKQALFSENEPVQATLPALTSEIEEALPATPKLN